MSKNYARRRSTKQKENKHENAFLFELDDETIFDLRMYSSSSIVILTYLCNNRLYSNDVDSNDDDLCD